MDKIKKQDDSVMKALNVNVIRRLICNTDKGPLDLVIRKEENNYFLMLDSTPLEKEVNDKLMGILFAKEIPQVNIKPISKEAEKIIVANATEIIKKKIGRPSKVK